MINRCFHTDELQSINNLKILIASIAFSLVIAPRDNISLAIRTASDKCSFSAFAFNNNSRRIFLGAGGLKLLSSQIFLTCFRKRSRSTGTSETLEMNILQIFLRIARGVRDADSGSLDRDLNGQKRQKSRPFYYCLGARIYQVFLNFQICATVV